MFDRTFNVCIIHVFSSRCKFLYFYINFNYLFNFLINERTMIQKKMMTIMIHYLRWIKDIELWANDIMNKDQMKT